jgi:diacylglycerol O-acyltransferase 1
MGPHIVNVVDHYHDENYTKMIGEFLRLPIPNTYAWLIFFYASFHSWLNLLAELTGFADRLFYQDWWNSQTLGEYWRLWNLPVHHWFLKHVYFPMRRRKYSRTVSSITVFTISALLHEYAIGSIFKVLTGVGFFGIFLQFPIILLQEKYKKWMGGLVGNIIFWLTFCCVGQPFGAVFIYFFLKRNIIGH